jgi:cytochrome c oxidase cbb3-type subunit 3
MKRSLCATLSGLAVSGVLILPSAANDAATAEKLLQTPVSHLSPGDVAPPPPVPSPRQNDPAAAQRGMNYFNAFNCVGCHAPNGGGGMGPSLSMRPYIYGSEPANIFLTIKQGRPNGMPAWGEMLPSDVIWDLAAYVQNLSAGPERSWGTTVSANSPKVQQISAGVVVTDKPWSQTQPFKKGQKP